MQRRVFLSAMAAPALPAAPIQGKGITAKRGVVSANPARAADIGARMLEAGGNAMDAAAAACLAGCVLQPYSTDIGGYVASGVVLEARTGKIWSIDSNSVATAAARPGMFEVLAMRSGAKDTNENEYGCSVRGDANVYGPLAVGVPGCLAGIGILSERWGKLKWARLLEPLQTAVSDGFPFGTIAAAVASRAKQIERFPASKQHLMPAGRLPDAAEIWRRPGMEKTLARLSSAGWRDLYEGELGRQIADHIQSMGGILSRKDMASFQPRVGEPHSLRLGSAAIHTAIVPNGGVSSLSAMAMLDKLPRREPGDPMYWHGMMEVLKLVWRDRIQFLADGVAAERFLSEAYIAEKVRTLLAKPGFVDSTPGPTPNPTSGTIHISTADSEGNLVSITISHGGAFGSCVTVPGTGITLGHGMCRFDPHPGLPNSPGPGKRPLNNVCPSIMRLPERDIAVGLSGGRRIVSVQTTTCSHLLRGMTAQQAVDAGRIHTEGYQPVEMSKAMPDAIVRELERMGHKLKTAANIGSSVNIAERLKNGTLRGGCTGVCSGVG
ncbi:MAG: gamma-glutamyltransferase [Candidatus Solibacter usitatus]|nr:gamma-glutamyltransferase [Candidatus Solibacter usitatus]